MSNDEIRNDNVVGTYFKTLEKIKPLTRMQEKDLLIDYKVNHNIEARNKLITSNLRYACKLASSYRNHGISYADLISEANDGLIEAIENWDLSKDVKVISYAKWWMMQRMDNAIKRKSRMPEDELPTDNESPIDVDDDIEKRDDNTDYQQNNTFIIDEEIEEEEIDRQQFLTELFKLLSEREIDMIEMYYGINGNQENTLDKIGEKYKLTKERARQIIENAFKKMRSESMLINSKYLSR